MNPEYIEFIYFSMVTLDMLFILFWISQYFFRSLPGLQRLVSMTNDSY